MTNSVNIPAEVTDDLLIPLEKVMNDPRTRRRAAGFFIIWGSKNIIGSDGQGSVEGQCPACRENVRLEGKQVRRWFTLYFIPIFPTGAPIRFTQCSRCKSQFHGTLEEFRRRAGRNATGAGSPSFQDAIALFNDMRETPTDSNKLARLMRMYAELGEPGEVLSAAKNYPDAVDGSAACLGLMAHASLLLNRRDDAARFAAAALVLDPADSAAIAVQQILASPEGIQTPA
jgi:hypothetical protein